MSEALIALVDARDEAKVEDLGRERERSWLVRKVGAGG